MSAQPPKTPPLLHGRYRILTRLGEGRLATVYRAEDERLRRQVLVHLLRADLAQQPNLRQRFEEEARRGAQRSHPGLMEVYDSGEVGGRLYMVTEDVSGRSLAEAELLSPGEALMIVRTIVSAVAMAQSQNAPFPPISSRNVWLLPGGRSVLLENWTMTRESISLDLAAYRAPERLRGAPPSSATSVYALGVLAWEAFVGRRPFSGPTPESIAQQQLRADPPPISQARPTVFSPELDRIIGQAVASDPAMRYPSPVDFGRALDHYADSVSAHTGRLPVQPYVPEPEIQPPSRGTRVGRALIGRRSQPVADDAPPPPHTSHRQRGAVAPPPPPPVIRDEPPPQTRTIVPAPAYDQRDVDRQIKREVKRQVRRQGCQRAIVKRSLQLGFLILFLWGAWLGINYAVDYARGQVQQIDIGTWISRQLPDPSSLLPDWLRDPGSLTATYRVAQPVNLRNEPRVADETFIMRLEAGTLVQQLGAPQPDESGQPYEWIQVIVLPSGERGWVANQANRLERQ